MTSVLIKKKYQKSDDEPNTGNQVNLKDEKKQQNNSSGSESEYRSFACPSCGKTFASSSGLKQHMHIHGSIKPYKCEICSKAYTQFSNLCRHKRSHSDCKTQFVCKFCRSAFQSTISLSKHEAICKGKSAIKIKLATSLGQESAPKKTDNFDPFPGKEMPAENSFLMAQNPHQSSSPKSFESSKKTSPRNPHPTVDSSPQFGNNFFELLKNQQQQLGQNSAHMNPLYNFIKTVWPHSQAIPNPFLQLNPALQIASLLGGGNPMLNNALNSRLPDNNMLGKFLNQALVDQQFNNTFANEEFLSGEPINLSNKKAHLNDSTENNEVPLDLSNRKKHDKSNIDLTKQQNLQSLTSLLGQQRAAHLNDTEHQDLKQIFDTTLKLHSTNETLKVKKAQKSSQISPSSLSSSSLSSPFSSASSSSSSSSSSCSSTSSFSPSSFDTKFNDQQHQLRLNHIENEKHNRKLNKLNALPMVKETLNGQLKMKAKSQFDDLKKSIDGLDNNKPALSSKKLKHFDSKELNENSLEKLSEEEEWEEEQNMNSYDDLTKPSENEQTNGLSRVSNEISTMGVDTQTRSGKDKHVCKFCDKAFPRSANLTRHLRTHTGEQPYSCRYCERSFSISSNLQRHIRNIHNREKPFKCVKCQRCFGQQTNLDRHMRKHDHGQIMPSQGNDNAGNQMQKSNFNININKAGKKASKGLANKFGDKLESNVNNFNKISGLTDKNQMNNKKSSLVNNSESLGRSIEDEDELDDYEDEEEDEEEEIEDEDDEEEEYEHFEALDNENIDEHSENTNKKSSLAIEGNNKKILISS